MHDQSRVVAEYWSINCVPLPDQIPFTTTDRSRLFILVSKTTDVSSSDAHGSYMLCGSRIVRCGRYGGKVRRQESTSYHFLNRG